MLSSSYDCFTSRSFCVSYLILALALCWSKCATVLGAAVDANTKKLGK